MPGGPRYFRQHRTQGLLNDTGLADALAPSTTRWPVAVFWSTDRSTLEPDRSPNSLSKSEFGDSRRLRASTDDLNKTAERPHSKVANLRSRPQGDARDRVSKWSLGSGIGRSADGSRGGSHPARSGIATMAKPKCAQVAVALSLAPQLHHSTASVALNRTHCGWLVHALRAHCCCMQR